MLGYGQFLENPFMVTFPLWHSLGGLRGSYWSSVPLWLSVSLYNSWDVNVLLGNTDMFPEFVFASFVTLAPIFIYVWCNSCLHFVEIQEWSLSCVHCLFSPQVTEYLELIVMEERPLEGVHVRKSQRTAAPGWCSEACCCVAVFAVVLLPTSDCVISCLDVGRTESSLFSFWRWMWKKWKQ